MTVMGKTLAVFVMEGQVIAMDAECPHEGGPLYEGTVERGCIVCPWHGYEFELHTGRCDTDPNLSDRRYPTFIEEGDVWIDLKDESIHR